MKVLKAVAGGATIVATFVGLGLSYQGLALKSVNHGEQFTELALEIESNNLMDIGVVDFNGDHILDIFTTNHHSRQSLLRGSGDGRFIDVLSELGLDQDLDFPWAEISAAVPVTDKPGLYIFWQNEGLVLKWKPLTVGGEVAGWIHVSSPALIRGRDGFEVDKQQTLRENGIPMTAIKFRGGAEGRMTVSTPYIGIPFRFRLEDGLSLRHVYIGRHRINPEREDFEIFLNDRHGMAWADYNHDGKMDVFATRGGLRGRMSLFPGTFSDELFVRQGDRFVNVIEESGIVKDSCPGYNVQWVDFNQDDKLDLYVACHHNHRNQLHENQGDGKFVNRAEALELDFAGSLTDTPFTWGDFDQDGDPDLLVTKEEGVVLFKNMSGRFEPEQVFEIRGVSRVSIGDCDADGDLDAFLVSYSGMNALLRNTGERFNFESAEALGLSRGALVANWVDYNNDGLLDLHFVPGGLFRQKSDGSFRPTGLLKHRFRGVVKRARASWFDLDNDGDRDLLMAVYYHSALWKRIISELLGEHTPSWARARGPHGEWDVRVFENRGKGNVENNHWLEVELVGRDGNRQAIGAQVLVSRGDSAVVAHVGQADGSMFSQGHFRLYFGLGTLGMVDEIMIRWPDGLTQRIGPVDVDQLVIIEKVET